MKLQVIVIIAALFAAYFLYFRDRYVRYPVEIRLANKESRSLDVRILWRDGERVQFEKTGDSRYYFYPLRDLSYLSRAKLAFLPVSKDSPQRYQDSTSVDTRSIHAEAISKDIQQIEDQLIRLENKGQVSVSQTEQNTIARQTENLERKLNELRQKLDRFQGRRPTPVNAEPEPRFMF